MMKKTALITGASKGIGKAIALNLSKEFNVVINYNKSYDDALLLADSINKNGGCAKIFKADVTNPTEVKNMIEFTISHFKKLDVLVNNAGIAQQKLFTDITEFDWDTIINTNMSSVYNVTRHALKYMVHEKNGKIINISSVWGLVGASCEVHYSTAKAGIIGFTKSLAKEVAPSNITVNAVAPGVINTDMCNFDEETIEMLKNEIPLGRIGSPDDVANVVGFLASDSSNYITGQVINVSGGFVV